MGSTDLAGGVLKSPDRYANPRRRCSIRPKQAWNWTWNCTRAAASCVTSASVSVIPGTRSGAHPACRRIMWRASPFPSEGGGEAGGTPEAPPQPQARPEPRFPILREAGHGAGQHVGGEVLHRHPGEDEEPAVVHQPVEVGRPLRRGPPDVLVGHPPGAGGRGEGQGGHGPVLGAG